LDDIRRLIACRGGDFSEFSARSFRNGLSLHIIFLYPGFFIGFLNQFFISSGRIIPQIQADSGNAHERCR